MSQYEITFLLEKEGEQKELEELFKEHKSKLLHQDAWGKRTLSYPIKKKVSAYYYNWQFEIEPKDLKELKKKLDFNEKIMRYLLLVKENK